MSAPHPLSDEMIAEYWPDAEPAEIRRQFDALIAKCVARPYQGFPRFPEVMAPVLAWAAQLPGDRAAALATALADVPPHLREYMWTAGKPAFGEQRAYMDVVGDDGHGMGRQAIAVTPYIKGYNLAPWIAAASPGNVGALLAERQALRHAAENLVIAIGMGWDLAGVVDQMRVALGEVPA